MNSGWPGHLPSSALAAMAIGVCAAGTAEAGKFDGLWRAGSGIACYYTGDAEGALKIEDDVLFGSGLECRMTLPVNVRDMDALLYDMTCEGEDLRWSNRAMLMNAADGGLFLIWNGYAYKYEACDEVEAGPIATSDAPEE